jgi:RNA polymerase sigma-70 factor (ECF subfamily)
LFVLHAQKIEGCKAVTEDIVQDIFANLWKKRGNIHIDTSLQAYLYKSVASACIKHLEHTEVERKYGMYIQNMTDISDDGNNPLSMLTARETTDKIEKAKDALPERSKEVLALWEEGLNYREIAEKLGVSTNTVDTLIRQAIKALRKILENEK